MFKSGDCMKLENIQEEWENDASIDYADLANESLKIPKLHSKYWKIYTNEKLVLRKYKAEYVELKFEKTSFYVDGPTKDHIDKGWKVPDKGKIIKSEVQSYIDSDKELIHLSLKIGFQEEKVEFLQNIIQQINNRSFLIKNAIEWLKFSNGI